MAKRKKKRVEVNSIDKFLVKKSDSPTSSPTVVQLDTSDPADDSDTIISPFKEYPNGDDSRQANVSKSPVTSKEKSDETQSRTQRRLFSLFEPRSSKSQKSPTVVDTVVTIQAIVTIDDTPKRPTRSRKVVSNKKTTEPSVGCVRKTAEPSVECVTIEEDQLPEVITLNSQTVTASMSPIRKHPPPLLWTVKYKPRIPSDLVGQSVAVESLKSWLGDFFSNRRTLIGINGKRKKISSPALNKRTLNGSIDKISPALNKRTLNGSIDKISPALNKRTLNGFIDDRDFDSDEAAEENSCFLIHSTVHGIGKTTLIHAVAAETSSEVFEMNCSMKRSGKSVTSTLSEVTQSNRLGFGHRLGSSHRLSSGGGANQNGPPVSLMNFFKPKVVLTEAEERERRVKEGREKRRREKEAKRKEKEERMKEQEILREEKERREEEEKEKDRKQWKRKKRKRITIESDTEEESAVKNVSDVNVSNVSNSDTKVPKDILKMECPVSSLDTKLNTSIEASNKLSFSSNSFILFDDVDAIFNEEEDGFWKAVRCLIKESKVPVILTASSLVDSIKDKLRDIEVVTFSLLPPPVEDVEQHLTRICREENIDTRNLNLRKLITSYNCDIRRCVNELQFTEGRFHQFGIDGVNELQFTEGRFHQFGTEAVDLDDGTEEKQKRTDSADIETDLEGTDIEDNDQSNHGQVVDKIDHAQGRKRPYAQLYEPLYEYLSTADQLSTRFDLFSDQIRRYRHLVEGEVDELEEITSKRTFASELVHFMDSLYQELDQKSGRNESTSLTDLLDSFYIKDHEPSSLDTILADLSTAVNTQNRVNVSTGSIASDYLPFLVQICKEEESRLVALAEDRRRTRRFLHYFDSINLASASKGNILTFYDSSFIVNEENLPENLRGTKEGSRRLIDPTDEGLRGSSDEE